MDWTGRLALLYQSLVWDYMYGIVHYMELGWTKCSPTTKNFNLTFSKHKGIGSLNDLLRTYQVLLFLHLPLSDGNTGTSSLCFILHSKAVVLSSICHDIKVNREPKISILWSSIVLLISKPMQNKSNSKGCRSQLYSSGESFNPDLKQQVLI